jgi:hypothetical protein
VYSLAVLAAAGFVYCLLAFPPSIPEVAMPVPNAYEQVLRAGEPLVSLQSLMRPDQNGLQPTSGSIAEIRQKACADARAALAGEGRVPLEYSRNDDPMGRFVVLCRLMHALEAEASQATRENRFGDAIACYRDVFRLSALSARGGRLDDCSGRPLLEKEPIRALQEMTGSLSRDQCQTVIEMLASAHEDAESLEVLCERERVWKCHAWGWQGRLEDLIERITGGRDVSWVVNVEYVKEGEARSRITRGELALRMYHLDHGQFPERLEDLVPDYLPAVPEDPFSGHPLVYRRQADGYVLYSVGLEKNAGASWGYPPETEAKEAETPATAE